MFQFKSVEKPTKEQLGKLSEAPTQLYYADMLYKRKKLALIAYSLPEGTNLFIYNVLPYEVKETENIRGLLNLDIHIAAIGVVQMLVSHGVVPYIHKIHFNTVTDREQIMLLKEQHDIDTTQVTTFHISELESGVSTTLRSIYYPERFTNAYYAQVLLQNGLKVEVIIHKDKVYRIVDDMLIRYIVDISLGTSKVAIEKHNREYLEKCYYSGKGYPTFKPRDYEWKPVNEQTMPVHLFAQVNSGIVISDLLKLD